MCSSFWQLGYEDTVQVAVSSNTDPVLVAADSCPKRQSGSSRISESNSKQLQMFDRDGMIWDHSFITRILPAYYPPNSPMIGQNCPKPPLLEYSNLPGPLLHPNSAQRTKLVADRRESCGAATRGRRLSIERNLERGFPFTTM